MRVMRARFNGGQSMVELALLLPVFLFLSVVTLDLLRGVYYFSAVYNAAREGARYAIVHQCALDQACKNTIQDIPGIQSAARRLTIGLDQTNINFNPAPQLTNYSTGLSAYTKVKVTITYRFKVVTPIANQLINSCGCINLRSSAIMAIER